MKGGGDGGLAVGRHLVAAGQSRQPVAPALGHGHQPVEAGFQPLDAQAPRPAAAR